MFIKLFPEILNFSSFAVILTNQFLNSSCISFFSFVRSFSSLFIMKIYYFLDFDWPCFGIKSTFLYRTQNSSALFFQYNTQLGPPYHVLIDTNFINFSIKNKLDIMQSLMDCLYAKCKYRDFLANLLIISCSSLFEMLSLHLL